MEGRLRERSVDVCVALSGWTDRRVRGTPSFYVSPHLEFIYAPHMSWPQGGLCIAQIGIILAEGDCNQERCHRISRPASARTVFHLSDTTGSLIFIFDRNNKRMVPIVRNKNSLFHGCYSTTIARALRHWSLLETMSLIQDRRTI